MSDSTPEIARFLRGFSPFDELDARQLARVAAAAELETFALGEVIFSQGADPVEYLRVVRSGGVELVADGRVLDLLGEGELFGQASMLSGLPPGFEARAVPPETSCYRIGIGLAQEVLAAPEGLRYLTRSLLAEPTDLHVLARDFTRNAADDPVGRLLRGEPVVCRPNTSIREAAGRMGEAGATAVVVDLGNVGWGIVTDRDLRMKVLAAGLSADAPVSAAMSAPAFTCGADRPAGAVLLEMFDRGLRHCPVLSAGGRVLGVIEDMDLVAVRTRSSFYLRQRLADAQTVGELVAVARELAPMVISLHDAQVDAANVMAVYAVCVDTLTRRLLELALAALGPQRATLPTFAWLAMGSQARREALPSSDVDSALVWFPEGVAGEGVAGEGVAGAGGGLGAGGVDDANERAVRDRLLPIAGEVIAGLAACGLAADEHGVSAAAPAFVRSVGSWRRVAHSWLQDPTQDRALVLTSTLLDSRPVWGVLTGTPVADSLRPAPNHPTMLRQLARLAVARRPPTGFLRGLVVEHSGEHAGRLDLKQGGTVPILALARWAAVSAGVTSASTPERLAAAAQAGTLPAGEADTLRDAFTLINNLRLEHQVAQLRAGEPPDDFVSPEALSDLMRVQLKEAFRAINAIQKRVAAETSGRIARVG